MITTIDTATRSTNGKKPVKKAKPVKAMTAAQIANAHNVNPRKLRRALRAKNIRAPYDAAAILKIERIAKELAKRRA